MNHRLITLVILIVIQAHAFAGLLDGIWVNPDTNTDSIPKVEIKGTEFYWWGRTHPQDSRYGPFQLTLLGDGGFRAQPPGKYALFVDDAGFADKTFVIKRQGDQLVLEVLTVFKDNSKRANYYTTLLLNPQK